MSVEPDITIASRNNAGISLINEFKRKGFHFLSAGIPIGYYLTGYHIALWVLGGLLALAILIEYARLANTTVNRLFHKIVGNMLRDTESFHYSGATYLLISSFLVILVFHKEIAILCLFFLTLGDGVAAIIGKSFGRTKIFNKTLEGTLAFTIVSVGVGFFFSQIPFYIRFSGTIVAAIVELLPMRTSDNLRIPIVSGSVMELLLIGYLQSQDTPIGTGETVVEIFHTIAKYFV
jgi:dolichol kinase